MNPRKLLKKVLSSPANLRLHRHYRRSASLTDRIAVFGPVRTVVWQGSVGDRCPYANQLFIIRS